MQKKIEFHPEVIRSDMQSAQAVMRMTRAGTLRKIGPSLYSRNLNDTPEAVISRNLWH